MDFFSKDGEENVLRVYCTVFLTFMSLNSLSYEFTRDFIQGATWQEFPLQVTIAPESTERYQWTENALIEGIQVWHQALREPIDLWSYRPSHQGKLVTRNVIRWSDQFEQETGFSAFTLAITVRNGHGPYLYQTEIIFNGAHPQLQNQDSITHVMIHELGHTIGLGHSQDQQAIMYAYLNVTDRRHLAEDDELGLNEVVRISLERQQSEHRVLAGQTRDQAALSLGNCSMAPDHISLASSQIQWSFLIQLLLSFLITFVSLYLAKRIFFPMTR